MISRLTHLETNNGQSHVETLADSAAPTIDKSISCQSCSLNPIVQANDSLLLAARPQFAYFIMWVSGCELRAQWGGRSIVHTLD